MVNVEEFAKRLKILMNYHELSAAEFADKVSVQRSSISHILSGRNKPSLDFVLKILKSFPDVGLYWLLNGDGTFPKKMEEYTQTPTLFEQTGESTKNQPFVQDTDLSNISEKEIERIVVFYKDGTFKNYLP